MGLVAALQDALARDLAWRKREISALRATASMLDDTGGHVFRGGLVLLCAHWEGFLKRSANLYIEHIFSQDVAVRHLRPHVVAIAYFKDVMNAALAKFPGSEEQHLRLAAKILEGFDGPVTAAGWSADTEGNPGSDMLERIFRSIGLDPHLGMDGATWATTKVFINEQLVYARHQIAHGEGLPIPKDAFLERAGRVLELLDVVSDLIVEAAVRADYRTT